MPSVIEGSFSFRMLAVGSYLVFLNLAALVVLFAAWPGGKTFETFFSSFSAESRYLLMALVGGMLGTTVTLLLSLADLASRERFVASWTWWYFLMPFVGMSTGLIVYALVRGGLLKPEISVDALNPYTVTSIAALAGFLSKEVLFKLKSLVAKQFQTPDMRVDIKRVDRKKDERSGKDQ